MLQNAQLAALGIKLASVKQDDAAIPRCMPVMAHFPIPHPEKTPQLITCKTLKSKTSINEQAYSL